MKEIFELDDLVREFKLEFSSFKEKGPSPLHKSEKEVIRTSKVLCYSS